ncbi:MAG: L-seryl-tRNA(Sec) selenium transferase [Desulfobacteraceae bacterium]|nr:L-seryl-tRNA(Sec) selenium transferase [Desulfobacteraceae bacterium]
MSLNKNQQNFLKAIPSVDRLLTAVQNETELDLIPKNVIVRAIRETLDELRQNIIAKPNQANLNSPSLASTLGKVNLRAFELYALNLKRVVNATGVVVHTNLGRSCLPKAAIDHLAEISENYSNLEFNLEIGKRGSRYSIVEDLLCEISGAESALAVNNNAAAVLLCLETIARNKRVLISRGELVEIGGSFRIPDVMAKSGAILEEIGATNRTHLRDYETAISSETGLLLKVHTSNYSIVGFTASVSLPELVELGNRYNLPVMEDLGSGNFIDFQRYGLTAEPTVQNSVASGAGIVTFSGDKLLGGPQAGIIVGKKDIIENIKSNPLTRALRIDKLTLAALEATLRLYLNENQALNEIPTLRMITVSLEEIKARAHKLAGKLEKLNKADLTVKLCDLSSKAGGGALPLLELPSCCVGISIQNISANTIEAALRKYSPPIIGRIENDLFIFDPRTLKDDEPAVIAEAIGYMLSNIG